MTKIIIKESKIHTINGLINIEEIIAGDLILTDDGYKTCISNIKNETQYETLTIKTTNSYFKCCSIHFLPIYREIKIDYIQCLNIKTNISNKLLVSNICSSKNSNMVIPISFTPDIKREDRLFINNYNTEICWLFGIIIGSAVVSNETFIISFKDEETMNKTKNIIQSIGDNIELIIKINKYKRFYQIQCISRILTSFIETHLLNYNLNYLIYETTYDNKKSFIEGLFKSGICINNKPYVLKSFHPTLLYQIQLLCNDCLINTKLKDNTLTFLQDEILYFHEITDIIKKDKEMSDCYNLTIENDCNIFCNGYLI